MKIQALNQRLKFGKYKGKNIQWIIDNDIDYIIWGRDPKKLKEAYNERKKIDKSVIYEPCLFRFKAKFKDGKEALDYYLNKLKEVGKEDSVVYDKNQNTLY